MTIQFLSITGYDVFTWLLIGCVGYVIIYMLLHLFYNDQSNDDDFTNMMN